MSDKIELKDLGSRSDRPYTRDLHVRYDMMNDLTSAMATEIFREVIQKVSDHIAAVLVEAHGVAIMEKISPEAIANLAVASAGAKINETLNKKMPDKILKVTEEITRTEVYQRGVLGGLKRLR